ncbi:MAG: preprotein translocase, SecE subunit [Frankiales bacterium]|nr:preprotein translocase, SecE subunit [Frankiales bacterium]
MTETQEAPAPSPRPSNSPGPGGLALLWRWLPMLFLALRRRTRETVAEMRKVLWPSRKEMITYTTITVVFVTVMVALVSGLDLGLAKVVLAVFG